MRNFLVLSLSAAFFSGCLTSQENPNYELSTTYKGDSAATHQYVSTETTSPTAVSYETAPAVQVQTYPIDAQSPSATVMASTQTPALTTAPTDMVYGSRDVTGTPGFMAMESERQAVAIEAAADVMPEAEIISAAPLGAAGTPIAYDYARNMVAVDALTTGQKLPESVRVLPRVGQNYTVQPGDTVYSLSRKTCVGVNVIQSMNGLDANYAIKIGQSLTLPASVC